MSFLPAALGSGTRTLPQVRPGGTCRPSSSAPGRAPGIVTLSSSSSLDQAAAWSPSLTNRPYRPGQPIVRDGTDRHGPGPCTRNAVEERREESGTNGPWNLRADRVTPESRCPGEHRREEKGFRLEWINGGPSTRASGPMRAGCVAWRQVACRVKAHHVSARRSRPSSHQERENEAATCPQSRHRPHRDLRGRRRNCGSPGLLSRDSLLVTGPTRALARAARPRKGGVCRPSGEPCSRLL